MSSFNSNENFTNNHCLFVNCFDPVENFKEIENCHNQRIDFNPMMEGSTPNFS